MPKNILIPSDFSSTSFNAIEYAFDLFKECECTFFIYHAYYIIASSRTNPMFPVPDEYEYNQAHIEIDTKMEAFRKKVLSLSQNEKHTIHFEFEYGFLVEKVSKKVKKEKIDLIIMGTRGTTQDRDIAYGRNAIDVMEKVRDCPVLAIPKKVKFKFPGKIVYPTDFKSNVDINEIESFKTIARISNASIQIFHIGKEENLNQKQKEGKKQLENHLASFEYSFHWIENTKLLEGLLVFVKEQEGTMICFVNRKHWFFSNIFSNPLIKNLGVDTTVPLMALHGSSS
ncbi:universal stress protein [Aequorivita sp. H23M31]|uniref:Universal stress protein n=1 Tax=Aequorivita ciconiae TaxID=2494375 RepID=A0A410FZV8_9FLAO|nr:universal stress protein [Aequorivita sp. H23M31]QAA80523.1 universal stress protein [Aequorivita sp. H23M31]